jgi:hypothetical protein
MGSFSAVEVCNRALQKIGEGQITSLTDPSIAATECSRLYQPSLEKLQREHLWNFCKKRASLPAMGSAPAFEYSHQYNLPTDFLRLIDVGADVEWSLESGKILINQAGPLRIKYVALVEDPSKFDSIFREALASYMALELCEIFTQSRTKKEALFAEYEYTLRKASSTDAKEQHPMAIDESSWVNSRW